MCVAFHVSCNSFHVPRFHGFTPRVSCLSCRKVWRAIRCHASSTVFRVSRCPRHHARLMPPITPGLSDQNPSYQTRSDPAKTHHASGPSFQRSLLLRTSVSSSGMKSYLFGLLLLFRVGFRLLGDVDPEIASNRNQHQPIMDSNHHTFPPPSDFEARFRALAAKIEVLCVCVCVSCAQVQGLGFRVWGLGFGVEGVLLRVV